MSSKSALLGLTGAAAAGATALACNAYRKEIQAARKRVETGRQVIDSTNGPIEFAESGNGPAVLVIHGAGGGFDQGLDLGRTLLSENYRIIAPSRFGYLGTPLPADPCVEAQADAHLQLLDSLKLESVPVIGVSAGAPSVIQFCIRHPERCSALVLIVPLAYAPGREGGVTPSKTREQLLNAITGSDFLFWAATRVARPTLLKTILGTPLEDYLAVPPDEQRQIMQVLRNILPIGRRVAGIWNDGVIGATLTRYPLEQIRVPTLVIGAANCLYGTYEGALYTADHIPEAKFVGFPTGGHLLAGHVAEVRSEVASFLGDVVQSRKTAIAS